MKNLFGIIACLMFFSFSNVAHAQGKVGHVNTQDLVQSLPEYKTAEGDLQKYVTEMQQTDADMHKEYDEKVNKYLADSAKMTQPMREAKRQDIEDLAKRIQTFEGGSDQKMQEKQMTLLKPIQDKVTTGIKAVAKESGYSYVFDTGNGTSLVYYPEQDDLTDAVKKKIGGTAVVPKAGAGTPPKK